MLSKCAEKINTSDSTCDITKKIKNMSTFESKYNELRDWLDKNKRLPNYYDSDET